MWTQTLALLGVVISGAPEPLVAGAGAVEALRGCATDLRYLNQVAGWQVRWPREWAALTRDATHLEEAVLRFHQVPKVLTEEISALRAGLETPGRAPKAVVKRVLRQVEALAEELRQRAPRYFGVDEKRSAAKKWARMLENEVEPAIQNYARFLRRTYLPRANPMDGLAGIPNGPRCFSNAVRWWTSLDLSPEQITDIGRRLLEENRRDLARTRTGDETVESILARLRAPSDDVKGADLLKVSRAALRRARSTALRAFHALPSIELAVEPMEAHLRGSFPAGYYRGGASPAYVVNPSRPAERRLMAEVIAFHEGIPGHHLFAGYPRAGSFGTFNAGLLEGWAIYAEYLADELGLYRTTFDRQGMITKHLWAASRLVVEPGLHVHGWSRQRAIDEMRQRTALSSSEIELEVDRYLAMPGQSLAYMLGYDVLTRARQRAEATLGLRFNLRAFHHAVLEPGSRPLPEVVKDIEAWIASVRRASR